MMNFFKDIFLNQIVPWIISGGLGGLLLWKYRKKRESTEAAASEVQTFGEASEIFVNRLMITTDELRKATEQLTHLKAKNFQNGHELDLYREAIIRHLKTCKTNVEELKKEFKDIDKLYQDEEERKNNSEENA